MNRINNLYCLVGKSNAGKTAIVQALRNVCGYTVAESYADWPRCGSDKEVHAVAIPKKFEPISEPILRRNSPECLPGLTYETLDSSTIVVLDCKDVRKLLECYTSRPIKVIGISVPLHSRAGMDQDAEDFCGVEDLCDIIIPNHNLDIAVALVQDFINFCEESVWNMTDRNFFQLRRRVAGRGIYPSYEMVQITAYGAGHFHISHGTVSLTDDVDDEFLDELAEQYGWEPSDILGNPGALVVAQTAFENSGTKYDLPEEYPTFEAAAKALCQMLDLNWEKYGRDVGLIDG